MNDFRCTDVGKVKVVRVAARNIEKLSTRLIDCANAVAEDCKNGSAEPSQRNVENAELLRRDWAAQVGENYMQLMLLICSVIHTTYTYAPICLPGSPSHCSH